MKNLAKYLSSTLLALGLFVHSANAGDTPAFDRGINLEKSGYYKEAIDEFTHAIAEEPSDPYAYYNRGVCRKILGDYQGAIDDQTIAVSLDPSNGDAYFNMAESLQKLGKKDEAIVNYQKAADLLKVQGDDALYNMAIDSINSLKSQ
jgi:tetratricopeptide (TPR) repeat protein